MTMLSYIPTFGPSFGAAFFTLHYALYVKYHKNVVNSSQVVTLGDNYGGCKYAETPNISRYTSL
jgi:hypothetical protein